MMNHKKLLIGCGCALLVIVLVVCLALTIGNGTGEKPTLPSDGTTEATGPDGTTVTEPSGNTNPSENTAPSGNTDPTGTEASDPTEPSSDPTDPTALPTTPPPTAPTEPEQEGPPDDFVPTLPPDHTVPTQTQPAPEPVYDFDGATPSTLTLDQWTSWDTKTQQAFFRNFKYDDMTREEKHHIQWVVDYNCYTCGFEGHACNSQAHHDGVMQYIAEGCLMCGRHDCPCLLALNEGLWTDYDYTKCPYYDIKKDSSYYCQKCGYPIFSEAAVGEIGCSRRISIDVKCDNCGEMIYAGQCHHCVKK